MTTWLTDKDGNRCSVEYFGTAKKAQAALDSLKDCKNCTNCSYCSRCSYCSYCSGCSDCSDCSGCSNCSRCSGCSRCSRCSDCSGCSGLKDVKADAAGGPPPVPTVPNIHGAVFAAASQPGCFEMISWHCSTTHCRAGWVVTLAGEEGKALETFYNTELAAMMIYAASDPGFKINPARFYDNNEDALADMKRLAEKSAP